MTIHVYVKVSLGDCELSAAAPVFRRYVATAPNLQPYQLASPLCVIQKVRLTIPFFAPWISRVST